ncbi:MAG: hypothetical protein KDD36_12255 [Flavobacteriales bacterium]|nr:hypothetical protein [Flavobacteriales bacterium]
MSTFFDRYENNDSQVNQTPGGTRAQVQSSYQHKYVEHRMEFVARIRGVDYINHSIATNLEGVWDSLAKSDKPVVWIAGNIDHQADYNMLNEVISDHVKAIVAMGPHKNFRLMQAFSKYVKTMVDATNMDEAVMYACSIAEPGYKILFSPGCGSYGEYESFKERGRDFKTRVIDIYKGLLRG